MVMNRIQKERDYIEWLYNCQFLIQKFIYKGKSRSVIFVQL